MSIINLPYPMQPSIIGMPVEGAQTAWTAGRIICRLAGPLSDRKRGPVTENGGRNDPESMSERVYIFDTTLRDGEQSPGCSMTVPEKVRMAAKLVELGVDILEAGFPIASDGDYEAVDAISREFPWAHVAALARANRPDIEAAAHALRHAR